MTRDRPTCLWLRFDEIVANHWPSSWLLHINVVTRKIILRKRIYTFDATGDRNDETRKLPFETKKWSFTDRNRSWMRVLSTNQPFRASFVVSPFVVSSFRRFAVQTEEQANFNFLNLKRARWSSRRSPWRLGLPNLSARSSPDPSVNYLDDESRDGDPGMTKKPSA